MTMLIRISVIIPTRNEEAYIEKTLKQFVAIKNKFNMEIIVSDGGSIDNTVSIAKKYADHVLTASKIEKQNIAIGRNRGAKIASGDILFHTDADVIIPDIEKFFKTINHTFKDSSIIAATARLAVYPAEAKAIDNLMHRLFNFAIRFSMPFGAFLARGECQLIRKKNFNDIDGYDEKIVVGEDCEIFCRLHKIGSIAYLKDFCVFHSPRRFRNTGYMRVLLIYFREGLSLLLLRRSYLSEWRPER
jgi:glycosyltransferase involved in cell wall biosynthesis